jgi:hypothetical protein
MSSLDAANFEKYYPKDLIINPTSEILAANTATDKNNFTVVVPNLKIGSGYAFQFQYVFEDGVKSDWSNSYTLTTAGYVTKLTTPTITVTPATLGYIVSYTAQTDSNFAYAIIEESVSTSNTAPTSGYQQVGVTSSNPITITVGNVLKRWVRVKLTDKISGGTTYSNVVAVTPVDPVAEATDSVAPDPIQSATATPSADSSDSSGISGIINLSIVNAVATAPSDFNAYIVKIVRQSDSREWTQPFYSKTYLNTLSVKLGIVVGQSYSLSVATTDGRNQSAFVNVTGNPIAVSDTRSNTSVATAFVASATDSILNISWTASADASVQSYRVQLTTNADTSFSSPLQEVYANSNTVSFGGLSPNTTYRIRITAKYGTGLLSTNHLIGTATLNASGSISDGQAPTTNPSITTSNIKSLFGAFAITFPEVVNNDAVVYEVFIKTTNATGIVDPQYKVLEVGGTFAVVKTLADKTTALSYGTNYFIAIRAKDNDGVSTGTVTAVGPVQTTQVANADLAADSVFANNIKAGEIDASKMVTDLLFAEKTINVGETTSLNRVRLDGTTVTLNDFPTGTFSAKGRIFIGAGNYYSSGTSFYADNTGRFSIGDKLRFNGTDLTINGSGTFTGLLTTGSGSNVIKVGTGANGANNGIYIGASADYIYTDGTFSLGAGAITGSSTSLSVKGELEVKGTSKVIGDLQIDPSGSGVFYVGANKTIGGTGDKIIINSSGIAAYPSNTASPTFSLAKDGTGKIGGWQINATSLSAVSGTMTLNAADQTITFKNGFIMDNDIISVPVVSSTSSSGSSSTEIDTPESEYSSFASGSNSSASSTFAIKLPTQNTTNSPKFVMTNDATSGSSILLSNYGNSSFSSIQLANGGVDINLGRTGAITLRGFTAKYHYTYNYSVASAMLMIKPDGTVSSGRSIFKSGAAETSIVPSSGTSSHSHVGLIGDLMFSTAD